MAASLLPAASGGSMGLWNPEREREGDKREEGWEEGGRQGSNMSVWMEDNKM